MLALALFSWWYTTAWKDLGRGIGLRLDKTLDFFSVSLLMRTLFDPFRQISAGSVHGSVDAQFRAWADRTFSRFFGAFIRMMFVIIGLFGCLFVLLVGMVQIVLWPIIPLLPLIGILGMVMGWTL
jgi:hypothetical protein